MAGFETYSGHEAGEHADPWEEFASALAQAIEGAIMQEIEGGRSLPQAGPGGRIAGPPGPQGRQGRSRRRRQG